MLEKQAHTYKISHTLFDLYRFKIGYAFQN